ncbi:MAG: hypothetical protein SFY56_11145 [Bacteroidota bacterium]|nr:hypothetical protein [Bacteroidota bacterium]
MKIYHLLIIVLFSRCSDRSATNQSESKKSEKSIDCLDLNSLYEIKNAEGCGNFIIYGKLSNNKFLCIELDKKKLNLQYNHCKEIILNNYDSILLRVYIDEYKENDIKIINYCSDKKIIPLNKPIKYNAIGGTIVFNIHNPDNEGYYLVDAKLKNVKFKSIKTDTITVNNKAFKKIKVGINPG